MPIRKMLSKNVEENKTELRRTDFLASGRAYGDDVTGRTSRRIELFRMTLIPRRLQVVENGYRAAIRAERGKGYRPRGNAVGV